MDWLTTPRDARPLAACRITWGALALLRAGEGAALLLALYGPEAYRTSLVVDVPAWAAWGLLVLWAGGAAAVTVGWHTRAAGGVAALGIAGTLWTDAQLYSNHLYLIGLLLLLVGLAGGGAVWSLDARRRGPSPVIPAWPVFLVQTQLVAVYLFGALSKLNESWVTGEVLIGNLPRALITGLPQPAAVVMVLAMAMSTIVVELWLAVSVWRRRAWPDVPVIALLLHVDMVVLLPSVWRQIAIFAGVMLAGFWLWWPYAPRARVVVWDDSCTACASWVRAFQRLDWFGAHDWRGSSDAAVLARYGITRDEADHAIQWIGADGGRESGFVAVTRILEATPLGMFWAPLLRLPGVRTLGDRAYRRYAVRRSCAWQPAEEVAR